MNWEHSILLLCSCFSRSFGGNPLHCDCKLQWLRHRLLGSNNQFPYIRHIEMLKCATPSRLQGRTLVNLSEEVLCGKKMHAVTTPNLHQLTIVWWPMTAIAILHIFITFFSSKNSFTQLKNIIKLSYICFNFKLN